MTDYTRLRWVLVSLVLVAVGGARAQDVSGGGFYPFRGTARTVGLAGAYTAVSDDIGGLSYNPAGMAQMDRRMGELSWKANNTGDDYLSVGFIEPPRPGKLGGSLLYITADDGAGRSDDIFQFGYGQEIKPGIAAGASIRYHTVDAGGGADDQAFAFDLGMLYTPPGNPKWTLGLAALDVNEPAFGGIGNAKRVFNAGLAFRYDAATLLALDWYDIGSNANRSGARFGAERQLTRNLTLRTGFAEDAVAVGVGITTQYFSLEYGFQSIDNAPDMNMLSAVANF